MNKLFCVTSIEIERFGSERYAWLYLHALPPRTDCFEAAAELAVALRAVAGCAHVESTGRELDLQYTFDDCAFRFALDPVLGPVVECPYDSLALVRAKLGAVCVFADGV